MVLANDKQIELIWDDGSFGDARACSMYSNSQRIVNIISRIHYGKMANMSLGFECTTCQHLRRLDSASSADNADATQYRLHNTHYRANNKIKQLIETLPCRCIIIIRIEAQVR